MVQPSNTSLKNVAANYLRLLGANITSTTLKKDLEENPYYPTLLSLSDTFTKYKIDNKAFEVSRENFDCLEAPFI
jgi:hypothetical protein